MRVIAPAPLLYHHLYRCFYPLSLPDKTPLHALVADIVKLIDKGCDTGRIQKKTGANAEFIQDVMRMYLTHQNVGVQGILDRIEIKNK